MLEEQQQRGGDGLDDDVLVADHVEVQLVGLHEGGRRHLRQHVDHDVHGVGRGLVRGGRGRQQDLSEDGSQFNPPVGETVCFLVCTGGLFGQ